MLFITPLSLTPTIGEEGVGAAKAGRCLIASTGLQADVTFIGRDDVELEARGSGQESVTEDEVGGLLVCFNFSCSRVKTSTRRRAKEAIEKARFKVLRPII
jgi:hypothetical protein